MTTIDERSDRLAVLTGGWLHDLHAKTGHGVLRYGAREVVCVVDETHAGRTATEVVPFCERPAPVVASVREARELGATVLLIGVAPSGGKLAPQWRSALLAKFGEAVKDHGTVDRLPVLEGKSMFMTLASVHKPRVHEHRIAGGRTDGHRHEPEAGTPTDTTSMADEAPAAPPVVAAITPEPTPVPAPAAEAAPAGE